MKVCIVSNSDGRGGGYQAAYRLHESLKSIGIQSIFLVQIKTSNNEDVFGPTSKFEKYFSYIRPKIDKFPVRKYKKKGRGNFSPSWLPYSNIVNRINYINPDVVNFHFIAGGMISIKEILRINKPIVWTLHDMWPFTGGCHYNDKCEKYKNICCACTLLNSNTKDDLSRRIFLRKKRVYEKKKNLYVVGISKWITECAKDSVLFEGKKIFNIPNPIKSEYFNSIDKKISKKILNISQDKKTILFGASNAIDDERKGFKKLISAINKLETDNIELIVFGSNKLKQNTLKKFPINFLGYLYDDISLKIAYNAADVVVSPSLQENLSNVIMESLSCSTPVVAFNIGGNRDMIEHKKNGYLARPYFSSDLAKGIDWILNNDKYAELKRAARSKVLKNFSMNKIAREYEKIFIDIL